jgi:hypothetical protein
MNRKNMTWKVPFLTVRVKLGLILFLKGDLNQWRLVLCLMVEAECIRVLTVNGIGLLGLLSTKGEAVDTAITDALTDATRWLVYGSGYGNSCEWLVG